MSRFTMTLLAAATAAVAAIAVVALPAIGDSGTQGPDKNPDVSKFAACLAAHGLPGAPTTGAELKPWLANQDQDKVGPATEACKGVAPDGGPGPDIQRMIDCVRSHGIDAPTAPDDFKRWIGEHQDSKAVEDALVACKLAAAPKGTQIDPGAKPDCGAPADKPPADEPKQPATPDDTNGT